MNYLAEVPVTSTNEYVTYNLQENTLANAYSIDSNIANEEYFKEDTWLKVYVARSVGKPDINTLTSEDYRSIETLVLPNKGIKYIPEEIGLMKNLKVVNLSGNEITDIPNSIEYLFNIEYLNLSGNKIKSLSSSLVSLSKNAINLKAINISDNILFLNLDMLKEIPPTISVDISQNPIDGASLYKQLVLNGVSSLEYKLGEDINAIVSDISSRLRLYNTFTGSMEELDSDIEVGIFINDSDAIKDGKVVKEGQFALRVIPKNMQLLNGLENKAMMVLDFPLIVGSGEFGVSMVNTVEDVSSTYIEKFVKVAKVKANLQQEANVSSQAIAVVEYSSDMKVIGEYGDFYKVEYEEYTGYILKEDVAEVGYSLKQVVVDTTNVYTMKKLDSMIYATIPKNQLVKVYPTSNSELSAISYNGKIMYVKTVDLGDTVTYVGKITVDKSKVRATPSDTASAMGMMSKDDRVEIYEMVNELWYKIKYLDKVGYIKSSEVEITSEVKIPDSVQGTVIENNNSNITEEENTIINQGTTEKPTTGDDIFLDTLLVGGSLLSLSILNKKEKYVLNNNKDDENKDFND